MIRQAFPDHGFLAEERAGEGDVGQPPSAVPEISHPGLAWEADPSRPPAAGSSTPWTAPSISPTAIPHVLRVHRLEADGVLEYGVVYDPLRDELFEARRGGGASLNGTPIRVSGTDRLDRALIATGFPYDIRERVPETLARLGRLLGIVQGLRRGGSAALDLCYVACGRLDGFYEENLKPWDTAAGLLIVTEAGGKITTFDGGDYDLYSPNILASNGVLHPELLSCLSEQD